MILDPLLARAALAYIGAFAVLGVLLSVTV